ncbi:MAG: ABC transporter substrate-binding protein [Paracoccus sp. (in: a-proteobacteria)]|nr:ABC transporter substrate-binding protein [Paracoccus sp. (in: a-proteobacteria)]
MIRAAFLAGLIALPVGAGADPHPEARRVLAIGGSVTEIIYALGQQDRLIGRDTTSTYPEAAQTLPDVGYIRRLSPEGVLSLGPDLILAEEGAGPPEAVAILQASGIAYQTIPAAEDADGLAARITAVAQALGDEGAAKPHLDSLRADLDRLGALNAGVATPRRVLFILSLQGGRVLASGGDTAADAMIRLAGAENAVTGFAGYKLLTDEAILAAAPDVILMMQRGAAAGDDPGGHEPQDAQLWALPALAATPAGQAHRVLRMDGLYLLGFGPRTGKAALDLHRAIYGDG